MPHVDHFVPYFEIDLHSGGLGLFAAQLASALEALLALVLAEDASLVDAGFEPTQELIEWLAFASFHMHDA